MGAQIPRTRKGSLLQFCAHKSFCSIVFVCKVFWFSCASSQKFVLGDWVAFASDDVIPRISKNCGFISRTPGPEICVGNNVFKKFLRTFLKSRRFENIASPNPKNTKGISPTILLGTKNCENLTFGGTEDVSVGIAIIGMNLACPVQLMDSNGCNR